MKVERYIFTETQDGKGLIDAHFAICTAHLKKFMRTSQRNRIRVIATPKGLAYALAWNGGVQNSCVQLVRLDHEKLKDIERLLQAPLKSLNKIFTRCNDVMFFPSRISHEQIVTIPDVQRARDSSAEFRICVFAYSGIGSGSTISFSVDGNSKLLDSTTTLDADFMVEDDKDGDEVAEAADSVPEESVTNDFSYDDMSQGNSNVVVVDNETGDVDDEGDAATMANQLFADSINGYSSVDAECQDVNRHSSAKKVKLHLDYWSSRCKSLA